MFRAAGVTTAITTHRISTMSAIIQPNPMFGIDQFTFMLVGLA